MVTAPANKVAVLALTRGGAQLAGTIYKLLPGVQLVLPQRLAMAGHPADTLYFADWQQAAGTAFSRYRQLIFIMATGIVVRTLAPMLGSKRTDPAVLVIDEQGQFVISLLAGHLGGANELARRVAELLGARAVITTATDVNEKVAVDILARQLNCDIYPLHRVKLFNRYLAEGEPVALYSEWQLPPGLTAGFDLLKDRTDDPGTSPVVYITNKLLGPSQGARLILRPRNLVAGVGCRRGVGPEQIIRAVKTAFKRGGFSLLSLKALATVDIKMQEPGLQQAAAYLRVPLLEVTKEQIAALAGQYIQSDFVRESIGVGGVCEPAAITASGQGTIKLAKQKLGAVTVAIAEAKLW
ncbi:cobalamin (vitamin B12) biosynthesis CbiG protein [Desulfotomaculum nigrificans CO-1-SRB]|uniref:Cobalamin (Vitamin B12) biosynthesis CbiG protein n=1 Tax=Desulfotomaculum nigrificans (strain DSM 14880 / VKM B-2319 / CO-1-SRB) TaxID=868595 RepID=F6B828_DESCC|nr:cobalt-precorrin 5A hydrolase [Desulfotomaculum nigrificans]AEF93473.1 cobalamin (vitamin B12) biosynthesis CbiG protein [Desulfotomaculum nigrificans CO-1-SRB]